MKVLFHSWEFGLGTGGIGQYLYQMAVGLTKLGHECIIVTGSDIPQADQSFAEAGTVYRMYKRGEVRTRGVAELVIDIARRHDVDYIEGADHWGECDKLLAIPGRPKILIKYHSCQYLRKLAEVSSYYPWQRLLIKAAQFRIREQIRAEKNCVERCDAALAPSQRIFQEYLKQGARLPDQRALVPNIITYVPPYKKQQGRRPTILFVGRLEILKGIEYLPNILAEVKKKIPDVVLEVAGDDQYARGIGSLQRWLQKGFGPLQESVRFLGHLEWKRLTEAYERSWLLVFPTKWDNFPMTVLEAMSYGRPVVTTPNGGMPEMLEGTGAAVAAPDSGEFSSAVTALLVDEKLRIKTGEACRQRVIEHYTPEKVIPSYLHFINSVL